MSVLDQFSLKGKVALVTGSSAGLGQAVAVAFAEAGASVVGVATRDSKETGDRIRAVGGRFHAVQADLSRAEASGIIGEAVQAFGRLDILVNNAGIIRRADMIDFTEKDWDDVLDLNLKAAFFLSQAAARQYLKQGGGGKIVHIASMLSFQGGVRVVSYAASKSGIAGLTRAMANEWAKHGINVNAIAPGYMATDNTAALRADAVRNEDILKRIPAGRWGASEDLAGAAVFLASAASDYMNGAIVPVDGGWLAR
jgi:2-dehydro-3-deoxy-D-gluconate 5-dehydrogenase